MDKSDSQTISVTSNSGNVSIQNLSGYASGSTYEIVPSAGWSGSALITVAVSDNRNGSDSYTFNVHVSDHICGPVYGKTHWNRDTVYVTCDVILQDDATLIIDPGTVIKITNHSKIDIYGKLSAKGILGDTVLFTTPDSSGFSDYFPHKGWNGLKFHHNQTDTSVIAYCKFEYGSVYNPNNEYNTEENSGGAIYVSEYKNLLIENSFFDHNYAHLFGGAIYLLGTEAVIRNNKITHNRTNTGSIYTSLSKSVISKNYIVYNSAESAGGIYCSDSATISGNIICNNIATYNGGGLYCIKNPTIFNNIICNNSATSNDYWSGSGGGVYFGDANPIFINNLIGYNKAFEGGAIKSNLSNVTLQNCIIWGNSSYEQVISGYLKMDHCIYSDSAKDINSKGYGNTVHEGNPGFIHPPDGAGAQFDGYKADWSLSDTSYSINTGIPGTNITNFPTDIIGNERISDGTIDLGPYEFNQSLKNRRPVIKKVHQLHLLSNASIETIISVWDPDQNQTHIITASSGNPDILVEAISNDTSAILKLHSQNKWQGTTIIHVHVTDNSGQENSTAAQNIEVTVSDSICGNISENSVWGPDTVHVSCSLTLDDNVELTILPGTYIEFADDASFEVVGTIKALGTKSQPITFTAKNKDTGWQGIMYKNGFYAYSHPSGVMDDNDSSRFENCRFEYCNREVFFIDAFSKLKIQNSGFRYNKMSTIHMYEASPMILLNTFSDNTIPFSGNIIWCERYSDPLISGNIFAHNMCSSGSILFCDYVSNPLIINNVMAYNKSDNGTIQCYQSNPHIINNTLTENSAKNGGGIYCTWSSPHITNTILWKNDATESGNQLYAYGYSPLLEHCILKNNANDIHHDRPFESANSFYSLDPQFIDSLSDFRLSSNSPCINTGINEVEGIVIPPLDIIGKARIADSLIDIGAYEFQGIPEEIAPVDFSIDGSALYENTPVGTIIGKFSTLDPNRKNTHEYKLFSVDGIDNNNNDFCISGDTLKSTTIPDYEATPGCSILVQVTDNAGKSLIKSFIITIYDKNEKPVLLNPIRDTTIYKNSYFEFRIPDNTFSKEQYDYFIYSAHLTGEDALPDWLGINTTYGIFSGTPATVQTYNIVVKVLDFQYISEPDTFQINVIESPGTIDNEKLWDEVSVYPNPGSGKFYIRHIPEGEIQLTVYDSFGRTILKNIILPEEMQSGFDLSENPDGLYILRLCQKSRCKTIKLIKKRTGD